MEENKRKSNKKKLVIPALLALLIIIIGTSYAAYHYNFIGGVNTIATSEISLDLLESNTEIINITNALPLSDNEGKSQAETFDFAVTSKTARTTSIKYNLFIEKLEVDDGYISLNDNDIKIYLTDYSDNQLFEPKLISELTNYKFYTKIHNHDGSHVTVQNKFKLRAWIAGDVNVSNWNSSTELQYKFKIGVSVNEHETPSVVYSYNERLVYAGTPLDSIIVTPIEKQGYCITYTGHENEPWNSCSESNYGYSTQSKCEKALIDDEWGSDYACEAGSWTGNPTTIKQGYCAVYDDSNYPWNSCSDGNYGYSTQSDCEYDISYWGDGYICEAGSWEEELSSMGGIDEYTTDYNDLNKSFFVKYNIDNDKKVQSSEICFLRDNDLHCLKGGSGETYFNENKSILDSTFGQANCETNGDNYVCTNGINIAKIGNNGYVDYSVKEKYCTIDYDEAHCGSHIYDVNVIVNNGIISGNSSKQIALGDNVTFNLTPNSLDLEGIITCTNNQVATLNNNVLTVSNVTNNTTCTVTYSSVSTVFYSDGTLIINEKPSDRSANQLEHGAIVEEYEAMSDSNQYVFNHLAVDRPWKSYAGTSQIQLKNVEIGQRIYPTSTAYWFYNLEYMIKGDFTNLDTSNVVDMSWMFESAGYVDKIGYLYDSFELIGLSSWDTSKVTNMKYMFRNAGYNARSWNIGDLSNWNTSNVTDMYSMFSEAGSNGTTFNIGNLSNWDISKVTDMSNMFYLSGQSATTWSIGDLSNWDTSNVTNMSYMFREAGKNATTWNSIGTLKVYATNISSIFGFSFLAKATLNVYSNPSTYDAVFINAATANDALITVNYSSATTNIDSIIATKSSNSNVVKGVRLD